MLVLGSTLAPSMLHTAFPAFPVVVPPSESRRMISTWHSHNRVFRQLLLTFLNSDITCDESQERWGHFALLVASIWSVDAKLWTVSRNFPTFIPATSFPFPICLVRVFCLVRVKSNSGCIISYRTSWAHNRETERGAWYPNMVNFTILYFHSHAPVHFTHHILNTITIKGTCLPVFYFMSPLRRN